MRSFRVRKVFAAALLAVAVATSGAQAAGMRDLAPADEYFGRLKMSVLGIRNELASLERRAYSGDRNVAAMSGKLAMVDDAIRDWRAHYPRDTWLPRYQAQRTRVAALIAANGTVRPGYESSATSAAIQLLGTLHHRR